MKNALLILGMMLTTMTVDAQEKKEPVVLISTSYGDIKLKLYNETPQHRDNFLELARKGRFDGSIFHRVINRFMIQGGGSKDLQTIDNRPMIPAEFNAKFIHKKGALAAARTPDNVNPMKMSSGSQFYIVQGRTYTEEMVKGMEQRMGISYTDEQRKTYAEIGGTPHLDTQYTIFGEVIEGLDVVDKIAAVQTHQADVPVEPIPITVKVLSE